MDKKANQLIHASSPYLLQHAYNPVNWCPWGEEALHKAREEDKLLVISVGYSACHWCHVMEHQSFENDEVAEWMNKFYVSIKVDREERPDVDQVYMQAAYLTSGRGGWPLNVIALPDGRPVFGGTYFPRENWIKVLQYFATLYRNEPEKLRQQAQHLTEGIRQIDAFGPIQEEKDYNQRQQLDKGTALFYETIDMEWGGKKGAPKFMMPNIWEYLLTRYALEDDQQALAASIVTLEKMALGGLYDQLGGGFTRYSTDMYWKVPHFEKMLYDNGQLVSLYAHAYQLTGNPLYKRVILQTVDFCEREWRSSEGGFYSAYDADSEGEEGKYYTWTIDEIDMALGEDAADFKRLYTISGPGNWEHGINVLHREWNDEEAAKRLGKNEEALETWLADCHNRLLHIRNKRVRPGLDNKQLASWNALMLHGLCDAYIALGEEQLLEKAIRTAKFLEDRLLRDNDYLYRNYCNDKASIPAFLDDYALTIASFTLMYQVSFEERWLQFALRLMDTVLEQFNDQGSPYFYYTSANGEALISRPRELSDNVISASNSVMSHNLWQLGWIMDREDWRARSTQMCNGILNEVAHNTAFYANWARLILLMQHDPIQVAITGKNAQLWRNTLQKVFQPNVLWVGTSGRESIVPLLKGKISPKETTGFICRKFTCGLPLDSLENLSTELSSTDHQSFSE